MRFLVVILGSFFFAYACRISRPGNDAPDAKGQYAGSGADASNAPVIQPQRQATQGAIFAVNIDNDGRLMEKLNLRLDYFPPPRPDGVSIPTCYNEIRASAVIARLSCDAVPGLSMDLLASHAYQRCYTANPVKRIDPKTVPVLAGCKGKATLTVVAYSPDIKLDVER